VDFDVQRVTPDSGPLQLLVVGDTHVGYRHRPSSTKPPWAQAVDNRRTFSRCLTRARDLGIDTVVHAGDVFDHEITQADTDHVHEEIQRTHDAGIPFYFIHGTTTTKPVTRRYVEDPGSIWAVKR